MPQITDPADFIIVGENVHTTRIIRTKDPRIVDGPDGRQSIEFIDDQGATRFLPISEKEKETMEYSEGRVKHMRTAVRIAMEERSDDTEVALDYIKAAAHHQLEQGASFLDVNVDEVSLKLPEQIEAMKWLVGLLAPYSSVPLSIDSSNGEIIDAGLEAAAALNDTPPMLNSASLERIDALDAAVHYGSPVIVTAAGAEGMPQNTEERLGFATQMVENALAKGIEMNKLYVDPLVFPISVDGEFGKHCIDAIAGIRERFGPDIHITGGFSNVSFGLPERRLINDAFFVMAVEAGADSGIIDPIMNPPARSLSIDRNSTQFQFAHDVLTGADRHCKKYLKAARAGELELA
ncbi:MAG TPA: dihydropteroate synthase [Baekduia sp.]|nr:dihydropteroate synthase [Baekduia sp.]